MSTQQHLLSLRALGASDERLLAEELGRSGIRGDLAGVAEIIARMCAPDRADGYATVTDVMEDLSVCDL